MIAKILEIESELSYFFLDDDTQIPSCLRGLASRKSYLLVGLQLIVYLLDQRLHRDRDRFSRIKLGDRCVQ